jgi:hypothetical protein
MSIQTVSLTETGEDFGFAEADFVKKIDEAYTKRMVAKLFINDDDGYAMEHMPIVKRYDEASYDNSRLNMLLGYLMGKLQLDFLQLDKCPLLGLHDHKGILTSFWDGPPDAEFLMAVQDAWSTFHEYSHYAVSYGGPDVLDSETFVVNYETTD